ncbi:MAG: hypothetical protein GEU82_03290 [Luteitalea sp.]|nr:hypothetical protein [Luteitalea sp.]
MRAGPFADRLLPFAVSFAVTCIFFINLCAWIFECGCRSLWAGADALCNVHVADSRHCPFCSRGTLGYAAVMIAVSVPQAAVSAWTRWSRATRVLMCLLLFPASMVIAGLLLGAYDGYW